MRRASRFWAALAVCLLTTLPDAGRACWRSASSGPATIVVRMPAEAAIYFNGHPIPSTGDTRAFVTVIPLRNGEGNLSVKVEATLGGQVTSAEKQIVVRSGATTEVDFNDLVLASTEPHDALVDELGPAPKAASEVTSVPLFKP